MNKTLERRAPEDARTPNPRRNFLRGSAALTAAAGLLGAGRAEALEPEKADPALLPPNVPPWTRSQGGPFINPPYGLPSRHEAGVVRVLPRVAAAFPTGSRTPLQNLHGIITPSGLVYERHHAGVPDIDPNAHRLMLHGLVERPMMFTMEDLARFPSVSQVYFLECSGNSSAELKKPTGKTAQEIHGLLSCCEWTGVALSTVLQEAGIKRDAKWVLAEGADGAAMTRSVPLGKALDDALLVYAQNGEMLRPEQGYPLRLFLPGFEGNMNVKWLRRLKLGTEPFETREETATYTDLLPDGTSLQFTFHMEAKSVITFPSGGQKLKARGFYEISGLAWTGRGKVKRVEVTLDGGKSWVEARLQEPVLSKALARFRLPWQWDGGPALIASRCIDDAGVQPSMAEVLKLRGANSNYHNNAIQYWKIDADGSVQNVRA
ncbi:MAG TPA: sulfite dehydrogenase [Burkholderiales bacterium]|nr:sulfite dehydrogenase [Burkholderiales bacterium]